MVSRWTFVANHTGYNTLYFTAAALWARKGYALVWPQYWYASNEPANP